MKNIEKFKKNIDEIESALSYTFKKKDNIKLALTHSSYANEKKELKLESNERLEFLGDAILNLTITEYVFLKYKNLSEGEMTKTRANIVCETSLSKCADELGLGKYLLLGKGEELSGGRKRISLLSDVYEAVIGAIYIDGGISSAKKFILEKMIVIIKNSINGIIHMDFKTQLQEKIQKNSDAKIIYEVIDEKGPDHDKFFVSQVSVSDKILGIGKGKTKKEAEQNAAKEALRAIE